MSEIRRWVLRSDTVAEEASLAPGDVCKGREYWSKGTRLCKAVEVERLEAKFAESCQLNAELSGRDIDQRMEIEELQTRNNRLRAEVADLQKRKGNQ